MDLASYKKYVRAIVQRCQAAGAGVILTTITPITEDPDFRLNRQALEYNKFLQALAEEKQLPIARLHDAMFARIAAARAENPPVRVTADGVHPRSPGHVVMAKGILKAMGLSDASLAAVENEWAHSPRMLILGGRIMAAGGRTGSWCHMLTDGMNAGREMVTYKGATRKNAADYVKALQDAMAESKPKYLLVQYQKSDAEAGTPLAEFRKSAAELVDLAAKQGITVMMTSIPVVGDQPGSEANAKIAPYNAALREVARAKGFLWADIHGAMVAWCKANPGGRLTLDGQRFNHEGNKLMAETVLLALGHSPKSVAALAKTWDDWSSFTFRGAASVTLSINLSQAGQAALEALGNRYHKIDDGKVMQFGLNLLLKDDAKTNQQRVADFDRKWTVRQLPAGQGPYQRRVGFNFSKNQIEALDAKAAALGVNRQEVLGRAYKVGVHSLLVEDGLHLAPATAEAASK